MQAVQVVPGQCLDTERRNDGDVAMAPCRPGAAQQAFKLTSAGHLQRSRYIEHEVACVQALAVHANSYQNFPPYKTGTNRRRPDSDIAARAGVPNLFFAGDWLRPGFPAALMERVVSTGRQAANHVVLKHGVRQGDALDWNKSRIARPDCVAEDLARFDPAGTHTWKYFRNIAANEEPIVVNKGRRRSNLKTRVIRGTDRRTVSSRYLYLHPSSSLSASSSASSSASDSRSLTSFSEPRPSFCSCSPASSSSCAAAPCRSTVLPADIFSCPASVRSCACVWPANHHVPSRSRAPTWMAEVVGRVPLAQGGAGPRSVVRGTLCLIPLGTQWAAKAEGFGRSLAPLLPAPVLKQALRLFWHARGQTRWLLLALVAVEAAFAATSDEGWGGPLRLRRVSIALGRGARCRAWVVAHLGGWGRDDTAFASSRRVAARTWNVQPFAAASEAARPGSGRFRRAACGRGLLAPRLARLDRGGRGHISGEVPSMMSHRAIV